MIHAFRLAFTESVTTAFRPRGAAGRWNSEGVIVVYTAEHPALAALELLAAWDAYEDFSRYRLFRCDIHEEAVRDAVPELLAELVDVRDAQATRTIGDAWARSRTSVALRVPSVVSSASYNVLVNPDHPDFDDAVERTPLGPFRYDVRLVELLRRAKANDANAGRA